MEPALNAYAAVILGALLIEFALDWLANTLNLKTLDAPLPEAFRGVYDEDAYRRMQRYTRETTRFGRVTSSLALGLLLIFWWMGGFAFLDQAIRAWGFDERITGIAFIVALVLGRAVLFLPFDLYATFGLEQRYGFNRTTLRTFVLDRVKGLLLGAVLGLPVLWLVLYFFAEAGATAWLWAWLVLALISLVLQVIVPAWILPLFNTFEALEAGELRTALDRYASSVDFPLEEVYVVDGSRRSSRANAFFTGMGRHKRVALFDTLIEKQTTPELMAILAHEVGHFKKRHLLQTLLLGLAHNGILLFLLSIFLTHEGLFEAFGLAQPSVHAGLVFFGLLYAPIEMLLSIGLNAWSRRHEFEADRFAVETVAEPEALTTALKKLAVDNLSHLTPHPLYVFLNYSHPPLIERLRAIGQAIRRRPAVATE